MIKNKEKAKKILGIILLVIGLMVILSSAFMSGLLFIVSGLFMFPPTMKIIEEKTEKQISKKMKYLIIIGAVFLAFIFIPTNSSNNKEDAKKTSQTLLKEENKEVITEIHKINSDTKLEFNFTHENIEGKIYFIGKTNFPNNTKLSISVSNKKGYFAADGVIVNNNQFKSSGFTANGKELIGTYKVEISCYFNKDRQDENVLEQLIFLNSKDIKIDNNLIVGEFRTFEVFETINIGSNEQLKNNTQHCNTQYKLMTKTISEIEVKMEELKIMSKNSSSPNYGIEIAAWNRKVKEWRKNIEEEIDYNCCPDIKMSLGTSIINIDLLGMAYSRVNRKGYSDVKIYETQLIESITDAKKYLRKCK